MANRDNIVNFCDGYLKIREFEDQGINGLQVEGKNNVNTIITGVSVSNEFIKKAISKRADMVIVHHGLFWKMTSPVIKKSMKIRLKLLLDNDISLLAYHLPLDKHEEVGNNIQILNRLDLKMKEEIGIGYMGEYKIPMKFSDFVEKVNTLFDTDSLVFHHGKNTVKSVGIISGGSSKDLAEAIDRNLDVYLSGEPMEFTFHLSKDSDINVIFSGHYNTERFGVQALGKLLKDKFSVNVEHIDIECKV